MIGASPGRQVFAIRVDGRPVGVVKLVDIDPVHRSAELTIRIGEEAAYIDGRYVDMRVFGMFRPRGETRRSGAGGAFPGFGSLPALAGALLQECCSKACGKYLNFHESGCGGSPARGSGIGQRGA